MTTTVMTQNITKANVDQYENFFMIDFHSDDNRSSMFFSAQDCTAQEYETIAAACCQLVNAINQAGRKQ